MNILALAREEEEASAQIAEKDAASNAQTAAAAAGQTQSASKRLEDMVRGRVEGPIPNQTLSQFLNRAHVHPIVKSCVMGKETKVRTLARESFWWSFLVPSFRQKCGGIPDDLLPPKIIGALPRIFLMHLSLPVSQKRSSIPSNPT